MGVHVVHSLGDLERDLREVATEFKPLAARQVADVAKAGNTEARRFARRSAGRHGKHYPKAITAERRTPLRWEWGPDSAMPQGDMSFERGSRNQPPHHDLAQAADMHGAGDLSLRIQRRVLDRLFW